MENPNERIAYLLEVYAAKKATAAELNELMNWMQEAGEDSALKANFGQVWNYYQHNPHDQHHVNGDGMFTHIIESGKVQAPPAKAKVIRFTKIAAAAAVLLFLVTGAWFIFLKKEPAPQVATTRTTAPADIKPPTANRATITLGNGQIIYLDQAQNGALAKQGNVQVIKLANGQIAYRGGATAIVYNTLTNPRGSKIIEMTLGDGTRVWLNAASSVTYPAAFAGRERKISMSGEAYFEVAPIRLRSGQKMPFTVKVNGMEVEVLGTHFNIKAYNDDDAIKTTLLEGKVKVSSMVNGQWSILKPGEQVSLSQSSHLSQPIPVQTEEVMAWKNGMFRFNAANIKEIMRQAERWYNIQVIYEGDVAGLDFSGFVSRNENISEFLKIFETTGLVHFRIEANKVIVQK